MFDRIFKNYDVANRAISMAEMLGYFVDHVLSLFGQEAPKTWADIR